MSRTGNVARDGQAPGHERGPRDTALPDSTDLQAERSGQLRILPEPAIIHVRIPNFAAAMEIVRRPALRERALIIGGDSRGRGLVLAASPAAHEDGVSGGMEIKAALALCPAALVLPPTPAALEATAELLLAVLGRYTPDVAPEWRRARERREGRAARLAGCFGALLDVRGCDRLWGSTATIAALLAEDLAAQGYEARIGVASNPGVAAVASALAEPRAYRLVPVGNERAFLAELPLALLADLDDELLERLRALGLRRIGQLAELRAQSVHRRLGAAGALAHERARGVDSRLVVAPPAPEMLEAVCALEEPLVNTLALGHTLGQLAERLARQLAARGQSASTLTLVLTLETAARRPPTEVTEGAPAARHGAARRDPGQAPLFMPPPATPGAAVRTARRHTVRHSVPEAVCSRTLHLKEPVAGAPAILARATELLRQLAPATAVAALAIQARELGPAATQRSFLLVSAVTVRNEQLAAVSEQLRGRFGAHAARRASLDTDAVLPEERVVWCGAQGPGEPAPPIRVRTADDGQPLALRRGQGPWEPVRAIQGRWRLRSRWWAELTHRYYFRVETAHGAILEIYQEQQNSCWYLARRRD